MASSAASAIKERVAIRCEACDRPLVFTRSLPFSLECPGLHLQCLDCAESQVAEIYSPAWAGTGPRSWSFGAHPLHAIAYGLRELRLRFRLWWNGRLRTTA